MQIEQTSDERLVALKAYLASLVFARVTNVIAKEEDDVGFGEEDDAEKAYSFYFGFARTTSGNMYFNLKGHTSSHLLGLGIETAQNHGIPPQGGTWIVGILGPKRPKGPWFKQWATCTPQEKLFVDYLLGSADARYLDLEKLRFTDDKGEILMNFARILIQRDLAYFLEQRKNTNPTGVDFVVRQICQRFDMEMWYEYVELAENQRIYSAIIRPPAPKPVVDRLTSYGDPVGLNTPFAKLQV